jgi:hypothetical protein
MFAISILPKFLAGGRIISHLLISHPVIYLLRIFVGDNLCIRLLDKEDTAVWMSLKKLSDI